MESMSPCAKPECAGKDKLVCADDCTDLPRYQRYLMAAHDIGSAPGIDYSDLEQRYELYHEEVA